MNFNNQHQQQQNSCNVQPMTISQSIQAIQGHQGHQASQISSSINIPQLQDNVVMAEYLFYYQPYNDFQVYNITCKEISFDMIYCHNCLSQNNVTHVFYFQHPVDKKIYKIICEIVRYNYIVWMLNKIDYNVELNFNGQQQETFSKQHKENLEFHLKHYLTNYLAPINTFQQHIINQPLDNSQGYININI
ncbi:hypothetical protein C1646_763547 [Rhizophagus diaphanus]|nr:hypothetical protein C1646_763547 [Rhizophagus diaphanus] [Rhizophagus sp. MUCL 43196]